MTTEMETVQYESPVRIYGIEGKRDLHTDDIEGLKIYEVFDERSDIDAPDCLGDYKVVVEFTAVSTDELNEKKDTAKNIIELLDKLWIYVSAHPLIVTEYFKYRIVVPNPIPYLWSSNFKEVKANLCKKEKLLNGEMSFSGGNSWMVFSEFPLSEACKAIRKYEDIDEATCFLIDLHHLYLTSDPDQRPLFVLAKALELVESMTKGNSREQKSKYLEDYFGEKMTLTLAELLRISNTSREIRHAVLEKGVDTKLHSKLTLNEINEYAKNANIVIRYTVCGRLNIPFQFVERK